MITSSSRPGYVVSKKGTFGVVHREYVNLEGVEMVLIEWGPLRWLTPARKEDVKYLRGRYESDALKEAATWLKHLEV